MNYSEINPFLRYAMQIRFLESRGETGIRDCRLIYILSGNVSIRIGETDLSLGADTAFYCAAGMIYHFRAEEGADLLVINFDLTREHSETGSELAPVPLHSFSAAQVLTNPEVAEYAYLSSYAVVDCAYPLKEGMRNIIREFSAPERLHREKACALLKLLLIDFDRLLPSAPINIPDAVLTAVEFISAHYAEPIRNRDIACPVGYHEYHLNRLFIRYTGVGMHQYLMQFRLRKARELLLTGDLSLSCVASATGFSSDAHFSACFKQQFSLTPSAFRRKFRSMV